MVVEPVRYYWGNRMAERRRCDESEPQISAASGMRPASRIGDDRSLIQPAFHLLEKLPVRRPFGVPQSSRRMHGRGNPQAFQFRPERVIVGVSEVVAFDKHRPNECAAKAWDPGDAVQLLDGVVHVLQR